ncbi:helix-turn-helix domain-containing protein [Rhodopseudomonas parapalustris]
MREKIERDDAPVPRPASPLLHAFQEQLEALRLEAHQTRDEFAKHLGIPRSSYFYLMSAAANPTLEYVEQIAKSVGVESCTLLCARFRSTTGEAPNARASLGEAARKRLRPKKV